MSNSYEIAKERYAALGVDTEAVLARLQTLPLSLHCWQGDDVGGFDRVGDLTGGIQVTGNYPGKANTPDQLRQDLEEALRLLPRYLQSKSPCKLLRIERRSSRP